MNLHVIIKKSFPTLEKLLLEDDLQTFAQTSVVDSYKSNVSLNSAIRERLLLPSDRLYKCFVESGITDEETMVLGVMRAFKKYVSEKKAG